MDKQYALMSHYSSGSPNCQLSISKQEFLNYLKKSTIREFAIFSTCDNDNLLLGSHSLLPNGKYQVIFEKSMHGKVEVGQRRQNFEDDSILQDVYVSKEHSIESIISGYETQINRPFSLIPRSFTDGQCSVFFDVNTTYQILTSRETCVKAIKHYAKQKILDQFNKYICMFLKINIASANMYAITNLGHSGIDPLNLKFEYFDTTTDATKKSAALINEIIRMW
jgi:hypothetical protein